MSNTSYDKTNFLATLYFYKVLFKVTVSVLCLIGAVMSQEKRNNIFAILKVVEKYMGKHLIFEHTFGGILEKGHLYAIGSSVGKDLQGVMNCKDIDEPTQVSEFSEYSFKYNVWKFMYWKMFNVGVPIFK